MLTKDQTKFLQLSIVDQMKYSDIEQSMGVNRTQLSKWWNELKDEREKLSKVRQVWAKKCSEIDFWIFHDWYTTTKKECHYCNITEQQIRSLIDKEMINTKRLITRGKSLEIERRQPNKSYDEIDNLVFCCYWCNNAKTDEFTEQEFKPVGILISKIWKERIQNAD
jgi:hypothetical protein